MSVGCFDQFDVYLEFASWLNCQPSCPESGASLQRFTRRRKPSTFTRSAISGGKCARRRKWGILVRGGVFYGKPEPLSWKLHGATRRLRPAIFSVVRAPSEAGGDGGSRKSIRGMSCT